MDHRGNRHQKPRPRPAARRPTHPHPRHQAGGHPPRSARRPRQPVAGHGPSDHHAARRPRGDHGPAPDPRRGHADHAHRRHGPQRRRRPRSGPPGRHPREHVPGECERMHPPGAGDGPPATIPHPTRGRPGYGPPRTCSPTPPYCPARCPWKRRTVPDPRRMRAWTVRP